MSIPRAMRPLFGASSRLLFDQLAFAANSAAKPARRGLTTPSSRPFIGLHPTCLRCGPDPRFFSSSPSEPPKNPSDKESSQQPDHSESHSSSSSPSSSPYISFEHLNPSTRHDAPTPSPLQPPSPESQTKASNDIQQPKKPEQDQPKGHPQETPSASPPPSFSSTSSSSSSPDISSSVASFFDRAQNALFAASQQLNDLTGYSSIEALKTRVSTLETSMTTAQAALHSARTSYKAAVASRSATQREVTALLARQKTWTPADFERFTSLYRQDYDLDAEVARSASHLEECERSVEKLSIELSHGILNRYHEEQVWSDKIRRMSTWGTWGLMGVNILLFLVLQFGAEPWRRKRLVRGFEDKVREAIREERGVPVPATAAAATTTTPSAAPAATASVPLQQQEHDEQAAAVQFQKQQDEQKAKAAKATAEEHSTTGGAPSPAPREHWSPFASILPTTFEAWKTTLRDPDEIRAILRELWSERIIAIHMRDASIVALQGAAAGAALVGSLTLMILAIRT